MISGFLLSLACGFLPMFLMAGIIYWLDRYEKEPKRLLIGIFGWGAVVAVIGAMVLELLLGGSVLAVTGSKAAEEVMTASLFAPVAEEFLKGMAVLLVFLLARQEFDSVLDGIVYAAITALGFAATENTLYYFSAYAEEGRVGLISLVFLRLVIFGWQHPFFSAFTGIGLALARMSRAPALKIAAPLAGLGLAVFFHALFNTLITFISGLAGLAAAAMLFWTGWLLMFALIVYLIFREKRWLSEQLQEEVERRTITPGQYKIACSLFGQSLARFSALFTGRYHATRRFYQLCGELAHKKRQLAGMGEEMGNSRLVEALRAELAAVSAGL